MAEEGSVLSRRALNRATLARQLLLERSAMPPVEAVQHLVAMQSQAPLAPYVGLWTRLARFDPAEVSKLTDERTLVRVASLRTTIHLSTVPDAWALRALCQDRLERTFASTTWGQGLRKASLDLGPVMADARRLLEAQPLSRAELAPPLAERWPGHDPEALAYGATYHLPLVQVTPRGLWGEGGLARWAPLDRWTGTEGAPDPTEPDALVLRYLAAFGPASVKDVQAWCGVAKLKVVLERLRPQMVTFHDEGGRELFDLHDAPRPGEDVPAPFRYLPEYDNLLLGHDDRSRVGARPSDRAPAWAGNGARAGTILADGFFDGFWDLVVEGDTATLLVDPIDPLTKRQWAEAHEEGHALLGLLAPDAEHEVRQGRAEPPAKRTPPKRASS
jgi:hypothetical protein